MAPATAKKPHVQSIHDKKLLFAAKISSEGDDGIVLTSVPDGLSSDDDPNNSFILSETLLRTMLPDEGATG